jgi:hypothetical protein
MKTFTNRIFAGGVVIAQGGRQYKIGLDGSVSVQDEDAASFIGLAFVESGAVVPAGAGSVALTGQGADIAAATLASAVGVYRVSAILECTNNDAAAGTLTTTFSWTDGAGAQTNTTLTMDLTAKSTSSLSLLAQLASGNLTYAIANGGSYGAAKFAVYLVVERVQ